ncbi:MAG: acetate--CoA ligase family protein [Pseudonocardia sp.]|nr:acetate--CoA ligase family protein [Pseudonocardia sp.]
MAAQADTSGGDTSGGELSGVAAVLEARSVALVGASDNRAGVAGRVLRYLRDWGFAGPVYPVNPRRTEVQGERCWPSLAALPEVPELAVIAVPAQAAVQAVRECAEQGVRAAVILSAGFAEAGADGARLQEEMMAAARAGGVRVLGPNCIGAFNSGAGLPATFATALDGAIPTPGGVGIVSQSGAYGAHLAYLAGERGLGVRYLVTTGNEPDIDLAEALAWMAGRPEIEVVLVYAEGVKNGPRFLEALRVAHAARKPVVMVKVGRSDVGAEAARSHTAALTGSDEVYDAVLARYGVYRATSTEEQLDIAYACALARPRAGDRLGIVTVSGGVGIQLADAAERHGLAVPPMPAHARRAVLDLIPYASATNPVDCTAQALTHMDVFVAAWKVMLADGGFDALIGFFTTMPLSQNFASALRESIEAGTADRGERLVVLSFVATPDTVREYEKSGFLVFEDTDRAVRAVAALAQLGAAFDRPLPPPEAEAEPLQRRAYTEIEATSLLAAAGVSVLPQRLAADADAAVAAAAELGVPVALKIVSADIVHKSDVGGVALGLADPGAVRSAHDAVLAAARANAPDARIDGVLVTPMAPRGVEAIVGARIDPVFGPVVALGLGGVFVEVLRDVVLRPAPVSRDEAAAMVEELRGAALFAGVRGAGPADVGALADAVVSVSEFAARHREDLSSVEVNPLVVLPDGQGCRALDAVVETR